MTDPRGGDPVAAARALPKGSGVVFRHHQLAKAERRALFEAVRQVCRIRRHLLLLADAPAVALAWSADGAHERSARRSRGLRGVAVHDRRELALARRTSADLIFVSPVFVTRSHPDARTLGAVRLGLLLAGNRIPAVALGGMSVGGMKRLSGLPLHGWAAIDALRT